MPPVDVDDENSLLGRRRDEAGVIPLEDELFAVGREARVVQVAAPGLSAEDEVAVAAGAIHQHERRVLDPRVATGVTAYDAGRLGEDDLPRTGREAGVLVVRAGGLARARRALL